MEPVLETTDLTDEQLAAEAAREGSDGPAFVALVARHRQRVWQICYRLMGNEHDAADAAQEVFVRLFLNRAKFAGRSRFSTWLYGIALRTCLSLRRARGRRQRRVAPSEAASTGESLAGAREQTSERLDLAAALDTLEDEERALVILKYAEGYSIEELAAMFGLSESACKMRLSRSREKLQARFPHLAD